MTTSTKGCLALAHADVFEKNEKKNETTSVYRLTFSTFNHTPGFYLGYLRRRSFPPPPQKKNIYIFLSSQSISSYIGKKSRRDQASAHTVTFLKTVARDEPHCISGSVHIPLKKISGWEMPPDPPRKLVAFGHSGLLPKR